MDISTLPSSCVVVDERKHHGVHGGGSASLVIRPDVTAVDAMFVEKNRKNVYRKQPARGDHYKRGNHTPRRATSGAHAVEANISPRVVL